MSSSEENTLISYIRGTLAEKNEDSAVVEAHGVGYQIFVPVPVLSELPPLGESVKIYTYFSVREDGMSLFGFLSRQDLAMFKQLIGVNGIGPKSARRIWHARKLSSLGLDELKRMGVVLKRAQYFITCKGFAGAHPGRGTAGRERITQALIDPNVFGGSCEQLSLFTPPAVDDLITQGVAPRAAMRMVREEAVQCLAKAL